MTDAQYNEVIDLLRKVECLVRSAQPTRYVAPMRAPHDHIYQTPAQLPEGPLFYEPPWKVTCGDKPYVGTPYGDWHTSGYISPAEAHG